MTERFKAIVSVYVLFVKDGKLLMLRRANTGYEDGKYSLVAGHADGNEALTYATVREAKEESGVDIKPEDLRLKVVMHRIDDREQLDFFFEAKQWQGEPKNAEPEKCDDLNWFPLDQLPERTIPYIREAVRCYREGIIYAEFGWDKNNVIQ
jgi:8-oxo-dGTP diphosphatase